MAKIIGIIVVFASVLGGYVLSHGKIGALIQPFEVMIIGGAALGAFVINNQPKVLKATMKGLGGIFKGSKYTNARYLELMAMLYEILQKARKEGLSSPLRL